MNIRFLKKKHDKKITQKLFNYFKFERTSDGMEFLGEFENKDFSYWLTFVHHQIQAILQSKLIDGKAVKNYVNLTLYICGQRVDVAIIKDGCKSPHELLQEQKITLNGNSDHSKTYDRYFKSEDKQIRQIINGDRK
jgi:hypothetical protein